MDLKALVERLDPACREALEAAAGLTLSRTHYNVEIEHWLLKLMEQAGGDIPVILDRFAVDAGRLEAELNRTLDAMKTGNGRAPALSPNLVKLVREAWLLASLQYEAKAVRAGHLLLALLSSDDLAPMAREASRQLQLIAPERLADDLPTLLAQADAGTDPATESGEDGEAPRAAAGGAGQALAKFCIDLTERARSGELDPVLGRDAEIRQIIDILSRRRQNNPILTGEAGVGKTAVVEGFALRIVAGDVPEVLRNVRVLTLDLGLLQAGAGVKGEFENRLKSVIEEVKRSPAPIIMFVDEAHTLIGAGGTEGQGDAANLMKPALARGELRTIAATTWAEYKKYFEKDPALTRRFQVVKVEEPSEAVAIVMMRGMVDSLERHHGVRILEEAVEASVRLSHRYISGRQLPDKSVSLLDTACARVAVSRAATPAPVEDVRRRIEQLDVELRILEREQATGGDHAKVLAERTAAKTDAETERAALEARWAEEQALIARLAEARTALETVHAAPGADAPAVAPDEKPALAPEAARAEMNTVRSELDALQGEHPLVFDTVDRHAVADVLAAWTGIPVGRMVSDEVKGVLDLEARMAMRIRGQPQAISTIAEAMRVARAGLADPKKPLGVFLMCGTSGVGKTETALTLADLFYGGAQSLTVINMSEFKEEHKVSMLVGSPPGYVGYGEGGVLTEAVRRRPFGVILLDEMEKAHPGVQDVFYQVFDKGQLRDGQGRDIDFRNTVIIMTSNAGTETIEKLAADPETMPDAAGLTQALRPELLKTFKPAFLGRVTVVPYGPLSPEIIREIVEIALGRVRDRIAATYGAGFTWTPQAADAVAERCTETQSGARNIESILNQTVVPALASRMLSRMIEQKPAANVVISIDGAGEFGYQIS